MCDSQFFRFFHLNEVNKRNEKKVSFNRFSRPRAGGKRCWHLAPFGYTYNNNVRSISVWFRSNDYTADAGVSRKELKRRSNPFLLASRMPVKPALDRHLLPPHTLRLRLLAHGFVTADSRLYAAMPVYAYICARAYTAPPVVMKTLKGLAHIDQTAVVPRVQSRRQSLRSLSLSLFHIHPVDRRSLTTFHPRSCRTLDNNTTTQPPRHRRCFRRRRQRNSDARNRNYCRPAIGIGSRIPAGYDNA